MKQVKFIVTIVLLMCWLPLYAQEAEIKITRDSAPTGSDFRLNVFAGGFQRPLYLTHAGDGTGRLFVLEQTGKVWILDADGGRMTAPFLDVTRLVSRSAGRQWSEQGLLGLAFHPNYAENGTFFINYTDLNGSTIVARYQVSADANQADASSAQIIFQLRQPYPNHNGGHIDFGTDGYLYITLGDGGSANDPLGAGQNLRMLLGKLLRLDVDGAVPYAIPTDNPFVGVANALDEIWAYGLRNVWRFSFDRLTGDLYHADVGQNQWEEINFQPADSPGGENYGWNVWEGKHIFAGGSAKDHVPPVYEYAHAKGCSVTGGYVYRGAAIPALEAAYIFGDYCSGRIWALYRDGGLTWRGVELRHTGIPISSFGEDEAGELYLIDYRGTIYRFDAAA